MLFLRINHDFAYETEKLVREFFPDEKLNIVTNEPASETADTIESLILREGCWQKYTVRIACGGRQAARESVGDVADGDDAELFVCTLLYEALCAFTGYTPPWGLLTGVRPAKLMGMQRKALGDAGAKRFFIDSMRVSPQKTDLAFAVSENQDRIAALSGDNCFSLYVAIPFCPTRCSYCSFVSHSNDSAKKLIPDYVVLLCEEMKATAAVAAQLGLHLKSVYIGGGTPTTLNAQQLSKVIGTINEYFDLTECLEFTVEAGRPDTVAPEILAAIKNGGAGRISINPQTFNDAVLETIGRKHTAAQTLAAYQAAVDAGFTDINMDLIAGLPGDTAEGFARTLAQTLALQPAEITVHTLALKSAATMVTEKREIVAADTCAMLDHAAERLTASGYQPYYMYRQSRCIGNLENVGWAKPGFGSLYNVFMMEELHTVLACGAGAVTKLKEDGVNHIERIFNFKYPYEYISRFTEVLERKDKIFEFYENKQGS
ncbi:MAG: coproporphyrinogen dehydrogenase HemZ [Clostridia bacterium]|nr:coproporphyrinogen dehydrogenase HemZ [Clostridia bacterium]